MLYGRTVALFDEYRSDWVDYDVFQLDEARVKLERSGCCRPTTSQCCRRRHASPA